MQFDSYDYENFKLLFLCHVAYYVSYYESRGMRSVVFTPWQEVSENFGKDREIKR